MNKREILYYISSFITGATTLIIELVSFRMLAPYFGTSSYVTGITINIVLLALAIGYYVGGYIGDKFYNEKLPFFLLLLTSFYLFFIFIFYNKFLTLVSELNVIVGTILSVLSMFFTPIIIFAFIPTYFIKNLASKTTLGKTAGAIYSLSTIGSIIGGILTTFIFIPYFGSKTTFLLGIVIIFIISIIGLTISLKQLFLLIFFLPIFFIPTKSYEYNFIYSKESEYNIIKLEKVFDDIYVYLNNQFAFFSKSLNKDMLSESYFDYFLLGPIINNAKNILILGNGAGTSMISLSHFFKAKIEGIEIDSALTDVGKTFFNLRESENIKIIHQDARVYINRTKEKYDIIIVDLYNGGTYVPFHLATKEFFRAIYKKLNSDGIMIVNIPFYAQNNLLEEYYLNTIYSFFKNNFVADNILFSFKSNITISEIEKKLDNYNESNILKKRINEIRNNITECQIKNSKNFFTDNRSMIEKLTFSAIKR